MKNLKDLTQKAKEAVESLPEPLKTEAFKIILSNMLESSEKKEKIHQKTTVQKVMSKKGTKEMEDFSSKINRTKHPDIYKLKKALDRSLYVLRLARDELEVDGLLPLQISRILSTVFRLKSTQAAVNMALAGASSYVDRKPLRVQGGQGYEYILMHEGEKYLEGILKNGKNK